MTQRKDPADRSKRRGSENRKRQHIVGVRFTDGEIALLDETAKRMRESRARLLRNGALTAADLFRALKKAEDLVAERDGHVLKLLAENDSLRRECERLRDQMMAVPDA